MKKIIFLVIAAIALTVATTSCHLSTPQEDFDEAVEGRFYQKAAEVYFTANWFISFKDMTDQQVIELANWNAPTTSVEGQKLCFDLYRRSPEVYKYPNNLKSLIFNMSIETEVYFYNRVKATLLYEGTPKSAFDISHLGYDNNQLQNFLLDKALATMLKENLQLWINNEYFKESSYDGPAKLATQQKN